MPRGLSDQPFLKNPWATPRPFVLDMRKAKDDVGYEPVQTYDQAIGEVVQWVVGATQSKDWREVLPGASEYLGNKFDYEAEDRFLATLER